LARTLVNLTRAGTLDAYLVQYNEKRPHQGRLMEGRTPWAMFKRGAPKAKAAKSENVKQVA
jgi:hypothetical protein